MMAPPPPCGGAGAEDAPFRDALEREGTFRIRRAVERLREGLFDPVAVRLLTAHEERLREEVERGFRTLAAGARPHLCLVGAYGQGKSHSLVYTQEMALRKGFVTSLINLDPREVPFHNIRAVYRELMARLRFPDVEDSFPVLWRSWAQQQLGEADRPGGSVLELLPDRMPHLFKAILAAIVHGNAPLSPKEKRLKKHAAFRPREFPMHLARALEGEPVPLPRLRSVFQYRQVSFYKDAPLSTPGPEPYLRMIEALSVLFQRMGYGGWVLLLDEGESITQAGILARSRSYRFLHRLLGREAAEPAPLYPVLAFTDDFFQRAAEEDYDRVRVRGEQEIPYFDRHYAREWKDLNLYRLLDLSPGEWQELCQKLAGLHARAYGWQPPEARVTQEMTQRLDTLRTQETRLKLKAIVDALDLVHQEQVL